MAAPFIYHANHIKLLFNLYELISLSSLYYFVRINHYYLSAFYILIPELI